MANHCTACGATMQFGILRHRYGCDQDKTQKPRIKVTGSPNLTEHPDLAALDDELQVLDDLFPADPS